MHRHVQRRWRQRGSQGFVAGCVGAGSMCAQQRIQATVCQHMRTQGLHLVPGARPKLHDLFAGKTWRERLTFISSK